MTEEEYFDFSKALRLVRGGKKVCRNDWEDKWLTLRKLPISSKFQPLYLLIYYTDNYFEPFMPNQQDLLAGDWRVYDDSKNL